MLKSLFIRLVAAFCLALLATPALHAQATPPKVLVLYDAPTGTEYEKFGLAYAIMLRNLLGHFDAQVDLQPVSGYTAGRINNYDTTFYLGAVYDSPVPAAFLADANTTTRRLVWFKYNIWQLAWNSTYTFQATRGISFLGLRGLNAAPSPTNPTPGFFSTVKFKAMDFVKYYAYDSTNNVVNADPDIGLTAISDATKATAVVSVTNPTTTEVAPYLLRSGNFWYMADIPFSFIGPRDRYLVFADQLHDMLGIPHAESKKALVRLEDVMAMVSVRNMKQLSDYLAKKHVPFSIGVTPHYLDPYGYYNNGVPLEVSLSQATNLKTSLDYALQRGAEIVMHGYTHQYAKVRNPYTAVTGDDFEFWNSVTNSPVAEDSTSWVLGRLDAGRTEFTANGYRPFAFETPHYQASAVSSRAFPQRFPTSYHRVVYYTADVPNFQSGAGKDFAVGQVFPYVIARDHYGQRLLPESLGNIEYDMHEIDPTATFNYTAQDIILNARYVRTVRDGVASFFFHPFLLNPDLHVPGLRDFQTTIDGISSLGFTWVKASTLP